MSYEACTQCIVLTFPEVFLIAEVSTLLNGLIDIVLETIDTVFVAIAFLRRTLLLAVELDDALVLSNVVDRRLQFAVCAVFCDWETQFYVAEVSVIDLGRQRVETITKGFIQNVA